MRRLWICALAVFRISDAAVCEASRGMSHLDYHDYQDSLSGQPDHFMVLTCKRCGKEFTI